jgi:hypothetical protein
VPGADVFEQPAAGPLEQVVDLDEPVGPAVVRVGHVGQALVGAEGGHPVDLGPRPLVGGAAQQRPLDGRIGDQQQVEPVPVVRPDRAGALGAQVEAPAGGLGDGAPVGRLALVLGAGARALDLDHAAQPGLVDHPPHDRLGGRRPADVAPAHEEHAGGGGGGDRVCGHVGPSVKAVRFVPSPPLTAQEARHR